MVCRDGGITDKRKEKSFERLIRITPLSLVGDLKHTMNVLGGRRYIISYPRT